MESLNQNLLFLRCTKCKEEKPDNVPIEEYARLQVGFTETKIVISCLRHCSVLMVLEVSNNQDMLQKVMSLERCKLEPTTVH